jgi:hypothetical protein
MKLQGVYGEQKTKKVQDLTNGDTILWNFGYSSLLVDLIPSKTGKTYTLVLKSNQDGITRERKMAATRLVAVA